MRDRDTSAITILLAVVAFVAFAVVAIRNWDYDRHDVEFSPNNYYKGQSIDQDDPKTQYAKLNNLQTTPGAKCDTTLVVSSNKQKTQRTTAGGGTEKNEIYWIEDGKTVTFTMLADGTVDTANNPMVAMKDNDLPTDKAYRPFMGATGTVAIIAPSTLAFKNSNVDGNRGDINMILRVGPDWEVHLTNVQSWFCCIGKESPWEHTVQVGAAGTADTQTAIAGSIIGAATKDTVMRVYRIDSAGQSVLVEPWELFSKSGVSVDVTVNDADMAADYSQTSSFLGKSTWEVIESPTVSAGAFVGIEDSDPNAYKLAKELWSKYSQKQQPSNQGSCWARSIGTIAQYWQATGSYSPKINWSDIYYKHPNSYTNGGSNIADADDVMRKYFSNHTWWNWEDYKDVDAPSPDDMLVFLRQDVPIHLRINCGAYRSGDTGHGSHAIAVVGFAALETGNEWLIVDSWEDDAEWWDEDNFFNNYRGLSCYRQNNPCPRGVKPQRIYGYH